MAPPLKPNVMVKKCHDILDAAGFARASNVVLGLDTRVQMVCDRLKAEIALSNQINENSTQYQNEIHDLQKEVEALRYKNAKLTAETIRLSKGVR